MKYLFKESPNMFHCFKMIRKTLQTFLFYRHTHKIFKEVWRSESDIENNSYSHSDTGHCTVLNYSHSDTGYYTVLNYSHSDTGHYTVLNYSHSDTGHCTVLNFLL